ncbi:MAG: ABC transporter ATP-binding protein [Candidatus Marinimicrobia bacterium]|nr:ABC transporter ATP-binding protein [Candidatus Neomarinimicrobiota bacterium]
MNICLKEVSFTYQNHFTLNIDLEIPANSWTMIVGKNGAGKSTLLKLLAGVIQPDQGTLSFGPSRVGYIFQNPDDQIIQLSLAKELAFDLENLGLPVQQIENKITDFLREYDFQGRSEQSPNTLSGGEKQRLALASTLISDPDILVFDEPTAFLDYRQKEKLYQKIEMLKKNKSILWVTHELDELFLADSIIEMEQGQISFKGSREQYLKRLSEIPFIRKHYLSCI